MDVANSHTMAKLETGSPVTVRRVEGSASVLEACYEGSDGAKGANNRVHSENDRF